MLVSDTLQNDALKCCYALNVFLASLQLVTNSCVMLYSEHQFLFLLMQQQNKIWNTHPVKEMDQQNNVIEISQGVNDKFIIYLIVYLILLYIT